MSDEKSLEDEIFDEFMLNEPPYKIESITKEELLSEEMFDYIANLKDSSGKMIEIEKLKEKAREFKVVTVFKNILKAKMKEKMVEELGASEIKGIIFPDKEEIVYKTNKYILDENNRIYEIIPDVGKILVCYHPILPIEILQNLEDKTYKVKLGYYINNEWKTIIVEKSIIASSQAIVKLADFGINVNSENAKYLVRYLTEIESLNEELIPKSTSVSRLGWFDGELIPYSKKYEVDNVRDIPNLDEMFSQSGNLEDWVKFFKERRKENPCARIVMASSVISILLEKIKQPGFTLHVYGESEYGKTVACMVAQSIFGNPSQDNKGLGINFNFTINGLESVLNKYNNLPLFVNEMQHQKDAKDYDKILFLVAEGKGKSRSTKNIGLAKQNAWHNVMITNGEKNIIKDNSNAGAYNRCFSYQLKDYSFKDLALVADFVKENYGTPIRKILEKVKDFDIKTIFKEKLEKLEEEDTSNKQKIIQALILTGDKLVVDILFEDGYYLKNEDLADSVVSRKDIMTEERALDLIKDWYVSESRHFWTEEDDKDSTEKRKLEIYGRKIEQNQIAFISTILKKKLEDNGFDSNETINAWNRKGYLACQESRNTKNVKINGNAIRCVVLNFRDEEDCEYEARAIENMEMPF